MVEVTPNLDSTVKHIETETGKPTKDFYNWLRDITRVIRGFGDIVTHDASEFTPATVVLDFVRITTVTANNTSTQLAITSGIDATYRAYKFLLNNVLHATDNQTFLFQVSVNAGASWLTGGYLSSSIYSASNTASGVGVGTAGVGMVPAGNCSSVAANGGWSGEFILHNPAGTVGNKWVSMHGTYVNQPASSSIHTDGGGAWIGNTPINAVRILSSSGNIASGSMTMYGMK